MAVLTPPTGPGILLALWSLRAESRSSECARGALGVVVTTADPQARIINHRHGALLVLAPVGSGKTYALVERISALIAAGEDPRRILCLTFTNRAAEEVRQRLTSQFPDGEMPVTVSTFHGLCATVLRREARAVGLPADFTICDDVDACDLMASILRSTSKDARDLLYYLGRIKSGVPYADLAWPLNFGVLRSELGSNYGSVKRYQQELRSQHLLDFSDLVLFTNAVLARVPESRRRWQEQFDFVMVDEIQDTHRSEYRVVYVLAHRTGNLAFFGDVDQTIYEWRGSAPQEIIDRFREDFSPVTEISLVENRRATRRLVEAAECFAVGTFREGTSANAAVATAELGELPVWHLAQDEMDEGHWIAQQIETLRAEPQFSYRRVGVLTANNHYGVGLSAVLTARGVPHITVEELDFFQRQEIKDALALARLMLNPNEAAAMNRIVERMIPGIGRAGLARIARVGKPVGLESIDLLKAETHAHGEPFGRLLDAYRRGRLVVLDVETTGLHRGAEIVEIAATRLEGGRIANRFYALVKSRQAVGESVHTHGLSDEQLGRDGRPPEEALDAAIRFIGDDLVVGHNIGFDVRMLGAQARRLSLDVPELTTADTLAVARRLLESDDCTLAGLASELGLRNVPEHRAVADVATTIELLAHLIPRLEASEIARQDIVDREGPPFAPLADDLDRWRELARQHRPARVLSRVVDESGLRAIYEKDASRRENLDTLVRLFEQRDTTGLDPWSALEEQVRSAALVRYVDQLLKSDDRVPVLTIHQAKGLEFDTVFIAGLFDGELPRGRAVRNNRLAEEQRLFYVALTRARRRLFLSAPRYSGHRVNEPSQFISVIDGSLLQTD